jgi:hypothetical protein
MPDKKSKIEKNVPQDAPLENRETEKERAPFDYYYDDGAGYEIYDSSDDAEEDDNCNSVSSASEKP